MRRPCSFFHVLFLFLSCFPFLLFIHIFVPILAHTAASLAGCALLCQHLPLSIHNDSNPTKAGK